MPSHAVGDTAERLAAAAPALISRVDGAAACELLGALFAARVVGSARELLTRLIRTDDLATLESVLRNVNRYDPAVREIVVGRLTERAAARDHHAVLACAHFLASAHLAQAEVVAALASVDESAPVQLQTDAALLLAEHGVHEVGVARTLARALAALVDRNGGFRLSNALGEVVRAGKLRDDETFRLLLDGFMARTDNAPFEGVDALRALLQNDDGLFELALDALAAAVEPERKKRAIVPVWSLLSEWSHAHPPDERLLRRFEARFAGSPMLFQELGLFALGRPSWYEALDCALADVDRNAESALDAAQHLSRVLGATPGADGDRLRSRMMAVLRQLLEHDVAHIALQAATELWFFGERDVRDALHRALAGPPLVAVRAAMALYGLGAEDDRVVAALLTCLSSDLETSWYMPERLIARPRLESTASSAGDDVGHGDDDDAVAGPWKGLAKMIATAPTVSATAAWLLVALRRNEVVPVLLNWIDGEDDRTCDQVLAMLEQPRCRARAASPGLADPAAS